MNSWKANLEETKRHYIDWWHRRGVIINMWEHFQKGVTPHADIPMPEPPRDLNQKWFDPEWRSRYLDWYVAHSCLKADILPVANTQLGPGSLAAILGARLEAGEDTIWIRQQTSTDAEFDKQDSLQLHKDLLRACKQRAQGHYYVGMPDLMEGLDVLAALRGTDQVLLDTVMHPEELERELQQVNDIYFQVFDELYDIIREGDEMAFCYFSLWAPGKCSKLQSDISTMISEDDFRRFVVPYIREQCQRIPYTLYHLDGVGALRHLPALLEIEELDAIQWTPGVGQPQGGDPKWYDLYRRILNAGKSVMACWVKPEELRPLLNAIGTEGVHVEMDFHNEQEVEEAMNSLTPNPSPEGRGETQQTFRRFSPPFGGGVGGGASESILVLDGAMGTMIQQYNLSEEDFRGKQFASHPVELKGCNDLLSITCPKVIRDIHRRYLEAGADIIETNTFNAQRISMADYGLEEHCREINLAAVRLARELADEFTRSNPSKPRYVAGSIGPTSRTVISEELSVKSEEFATAVPLGEDLAAANSSLFTLHSSLFTFQSSLKAAYEEQIQALTDGGVDFLLIETIFDVENARIAIEAARNVAPHLPIMLSFSVSTPDGHNMLGQSILEFLESIEHSPLTIHHSAACSNNGQRSMVNGQSIIYSIGLNCLADVAAMTPLVKELARFGTRVSLYPNMGMPDSHGRYTKAPEELLRDVWPLLEGHHLNIIGGCCGTTDAFTRLLAKVVEPVEGIFLSGLRPVKSEELRVKSEEFATALPSAEGTAAANSSLFTIHSSLTTPHSSLKEAILSGDSDAAVSATREALADGEAPQEIIDREMIAAMAEIGQRFEEGKAFVPQLLMASRAMKAALEIVKPLMASAGTANVAARVVIGTVKGDLHDIGKNLVVAMLEGNGFEVINLGIDVSADKFVEAVREHKPALLCLSALLTTTMNYMREVIAALEVAGLRQQVKIMVGGAPVTQAFADEIGADGYADNANGAVTVAKRLINNINYQ